MSHWRESRRSEPIAVDSLLLVRLPARSKITLVFAKSIFYNALFNKSVFTQGLASPDLIEVVFRANAFGLRSEYGLQSAASRLIVVEWLFLRRRHFANGFGRV